MRDLRRARGDAEPTDPGDFRAWLWTGFARRDDEAAQEADGQDDREDKPGGGPPTSHDGRSQTADRAGCARTAASFTSVPQPGPRGMVR